LPTGGSSKAAALTGTLRVANAQAALEIRKASFSE
jgi:hypothetical protein